MAEHAFFRKSSTVATKKSSIKTDTYTTKIGSVNFAMTNFESWSKFIETNNTQKLNDTNTQRMRTLMDRSIEAINKQDTERFGTPLPKNMEELENPKKFRRIDDYYRVYRSIQRELKKLQKSPKNQVQPQKRIVFTDREIGIFSFDRAAAGLRKGVMPDGTIKIVSDIKKVYAMHEMKPSQNRVIKIYADWTISRVQKQDELLYRGIFIAILSKELIAAKYNVEINMICSSEKNNVFAGSIVKLKAATKEIKLDDLLIATADVAAFRHLGFKNIICSYQRANKDCPDNLGNQRSDLANQFIKHIEKDTPYIFVPNINSEKDLLQNITTIIQSINNGIYYEGSQSKNS